MPKPTIPGSPEEPYRTKILLALIAEVKPTGGAVWCESNFLLIRYGVVGERTHITWTEAAILTHVEVPTMQKRIKQMMERAREIDRKPPTHESAVARPLTLHQLKEAKEEARRWHEQRQSTGLGRSMA